MIEVEAWLHTIGYRYTGPGSLYGLTFREINDLSEGQRLLELTKGGVSAAEESLLDSLAEEYA